MQESKLTQEQITSMSEVVAKYMGYKYTAMIDIDFSDCGGLYDRCKVFSKIPLEIDSYPDSDQYYIKVGWHQKANENGGYLINPDFVNWNFIHEVWDKINKEEELSIQLITDISNSLFDNNKEQAFTAIYNAIKFINEQQ